MKELWFWRVATAVACIGWAVTWWTGEETAPPESEVVASPGEHGGRGAGRGRGPGLGRGGGRGKSPSGGRGAGSGLEAVPIMDGSTPAVEVSEASMELAREELQAEREQAFLARMEDRRSAALDGLDAFAESQELSEEEVVAVEEAIEARFEAMGEAFAGEGMEGEARREHMRAVADAFEIQIIGALGEETGVLYLEQTQRPRFGQLGEGGAEE